MLSVLYVDDEQDLCELGKVFLEQSGEITVDTCTSAKAALSSPSIWSYDAIIADFQMPGMDGIEFLKAVRAHAPDIPFILFTGRGREEIVIAAINGGADFYLQKGGDPTSQFAELAHKIRIAVERRQAKTALKDSEQRLNNLFNFLPDATFAIDRSGVVLSWNHAIEEMTGVPAAEMLGKGNFEYAIPFYGTRRKILIDLIFESDEVIAKNYAHIFHEKDTLIAETSLPRPKGEPKILMGKASPLYNQQGEIVGAIESIRDITSLRRAEEAAAHTRKDWETIFRAIGHSAIVLDAENRIIDANDATLRMTGLSLDELKKKRCYEIFHRDGTCAPPPACPFERLRMEGSTAPAESDIEALGRYFHVSCTPVYDSQGRLEKVIHIAMDITERRKAQDEVKAAYEHVAASEEELRGQFDSLVQSEQRIRESEARFRELADMLPQVVFEMDMQMNVTYANRYALDTFGLTEADTTAGMHGLRFIAPRDHERIRENLAKILHNTPYDDHEYHAVRADGSEFPVLIYSSLISRNGQPAGLRGVIIDISALKNAEADLRENRNLLRSFMDSATDAFTIWDHRLNLVDLNLAALTYLPEGTRKEDLLGKNYEEFIPGARERGEFGRYMKVITTGIPFAGTEQIPGPRFGKRWVAIKAFQVGDGVGIVTSDITPQKDAEETLRASEAALSGIFNAAPVGIALIADRAILRVNDKIGEITGYSREELTGRNTRFLYPTDDEYDQVAKVNYHLGEKYGLSSVETRWRRKDGTLRNILLSGAPVSPGDPKQTWIIVVLDITETKQMEDELRLLKISVDRAHDEIFWMDFSGRILYVNDAACRITGYSREELESMKIFELDPDFPPTVWEMSVADLRKRKSQYIITRHRCKDGRIIDVEIVATYVKEDGAEYSFAFVRDISDRVRMEEQLSDQHRQLDNLMQNLPLGIFRISAGPPGRFVMVNPVLSQMFGYDTLEEFRQISPDNLTEDPEAGKKIVEFITSTGSLSGHEIRLRKKNGDPFWAAFSVISVPGTDGKTVYYDGVVWDITARKKAEDALSEANRKFKLLNSMTRHGILNQLTALQGFVQVALKSTTDEKLREYMTRIDNISQTIQRQTEFTRAYQELGINVPAWVRLDEVIQKTAAPVSVTHTDTCAGIEIFADPMLEQVFFNLFENAGRHGKQVTEIRVRCEWDARTLRIIVEDDGVGIPAGDKEKIFKKGFGTHTGLGLFLVKEILSITGITIRENGRPGAGARFEMEVPNGAFRVRK